MAYPESTPTGDGSTRDFSFTFQYLKESDIKVTVDGTATTAYSLPTATTVRFNVAPANGAAIRIYRETDVSNPQTTFFAGSAIRSQDLNENALQVLFASQEATENASQAPTAITTANTAKTTADAAAADAASALTAATNAVAFTPYANVAAIPASPSNGDYIEVLDATGIESFSPLTGVPSGFVGDSGLAARLNYTSNGSTWNWVNYIANNAETRYLKDLANTVDATNLASNSVTTDKITNGNVTVAKLENSLDLSQKTVTLPANSITGSMLQSGAAVPTGAVFYFAASSAPTGYLKANGAAISRTTYSDLFAAVGTTYGSGDGSTTFNLPDLRGEFIRGWDDGAGVDSGRTFGSSQTDQNKAHNHTASVSNAAHSYINATKVFQYGGDAVGAHGYSNSNTGVTIQNDGGNESRPRNVALLACIKY